MQKPLRIFFKLLSQSKIATLASGGISETRHDSADASSPQLSHSKLLYVADKGHKCRYLIDTGAAVSVLPKSCANGISGADSLPLVAANNSTMKTYGNCKRVVDVGLKREYLWTFIVADVQQPIIGADFLIHYNSLVDLRSRCLRTPFGLRNSGQTFQRFIDHVTRGLDFVFVYLDDLLVTSPDHKTHNKHLRILFARLSEYGIIIGPEKCQFGTSELSFLGHHVCAEGISPLPSAVDAIVNFIKPEKQRALRRYLGMVNYYHRFIPHCDDKLTPLNNLLTSANEGHTRLSPKSNFDLKWN